MPKNSEILELALSYTENNPEVWFKGALAGDADGNKLAIADDPSAVCWCAMGLVSKASQELDVEMCELTEINFDALDFLYPHAPGGYISFYNDAPETTHADVVRMFKLGIADAKAKEEKDEICHFKSTLCRSKFRITQLWLPNTCARIL